MAMHSRAFLLLRRDLINLQRFPLTGITAQPTDSNDLFHWRVKIEGLAGTIWEGGIFQVSLSFSDHFNTQPPEIHFMTIPFHPNVDPQDGRPCLYLLSEGGWTEDCSVSSVLLLLQAMLGNPELDTVCICNPGAARMIHDVPHTYKQMALDCVTASLRIDAGLTPHEEEQGAETEVMSIESEQKSMQSDMTDKRSLRQPVSFDDYHTLWKGIATSLTVYKQQSKLFSKVVGDNDRELMPAELKLGGIKHSKKRLSEPVSKTQRIEDLKQMYREATAPVIYTTNVTDMKAVHPDQEVKGESSGDEIDKLVEWTKELNEDELQNK